MPIQHDEKVIVRPSFSPLAIQQERQAFGGILPVAGIGLGGLPPYRVVQFMGQVREKIRPPENRMIFA